MLQALLLGKSGRNIGNVQIDALFSSFSRFPNVTGAVAGEERA